MVPEASKGLNVLVWRTARRLCGRQGVARIMAPPNLAPGLAVTTCLARKVTSNGTSLCLPPAWHKGD